MPRITRSGVALGAVVFVFAAVLVFGGRLFGDEGHSGAPPSVPANNPSLTVSAPGPVAQAKNSSVGSSGGALPDADGVQAASGDDAHVAPPPRQHAEPTGWPEMVLYVVLTVVSLILFIVAASTLWWMLHAWRSPEALAATGFRRRSAGRPLSYSLLLPARHEQHVLGDTIDALARLDHPLYEVIGIIGHDDPETEHVARAGAARHPRTVRVVIDDNMPKNKPKALNTALPACRGAVVMLDTPWLGRCPSE
jgi:hypothetical protein